MYNCGILFKKFFSKNYFSNIETNHQFQKLTESNKPGISYRTGIYLTDVEETDEGTKFNLLRCSTNFKGPTCGFSPDDKEILQKVNKISKECFRDEVELNHVLAQIYHNTVVTNNGRKREKKAKIKKHSDKTKDMSKNGLIAFCTFYKEFENEAFNIPGVKESKSEKCNFYYKKCSILTKLRFELKKDYWDSNMVKKFNIDLHPNSLFIISLKTNRFYTHEIVPSILPIEHLPTRMGYVIRCSNQKALFKNNKTYIMDGDSLSELKEQYIEGIHNLKCQYAKENITSEHLNYKKVDFSLNQGDYTQPLIFSSV